MPFITENRWISDVRSYLNSSYLPTLARLPGDLRSFTRKRILTPDVLLYNILDPGRETTSVKLSRMNGQVIPGRLSNPGNGGRTVSQQAFSKARGHLNPECVKGLFLNTLPEYVSGEDEGKDEYGCYHLMADGTWLRLYKTKENMAGSMVHENCPMAKVSMLYDGIGRCAADVMISFDRWNEITMLEESIRNIISRGALPKTLLVICDRGYESLPLFRELASMGVYFVIRGKKLSGRSAFLRLFGNATGTDSTVDVDGLSLRRVTIDLGEGKTEWLYTNDLRRPEESFKEIYHERWGIECAFKAAKGNYEIECVSGNSPLMVEQDFWATMALGNLMAAIERDVTIRANEEHPSDETHVRKANDNKAIGIMKQKLIMAIIEENPQRRETIISEIRDEMCRYVMVYKKNRSFGRSLSTNVRFPVNHRHNV